MSQQARSYPTTQFSGVSITPASAPASRIVPLAKSPEELLGPICVRISAILAIWRGGTITLAPHGGRHIPEKLRRDVDTLMAWHAPEDVQSHLLAISHSSERRAALLAKMQRVKHGLFGSGRVVDLVQGTTRTGEFTLVRTELEYGISSALKEAFRLIPVQA